MDQGDAVRERLDYACCSCAAVSARNTAGSPWISTLDCCSCSGNGRYAVYNYAFYLFGAALNIFFPLYVVIFLLGIATLGLLLSHLDVTAVAEDPFDAGTPGADHWRVSGLCRRGTCNRVAWHVGSVRVCPGLIGPTPIEPEAFKVVAALDLSLTVPTLTVGGVLLWRRKAWGYVIATIAAIQGALYLLVLSVNSAITIKSRSGRGTRRATDLGSADDFHSARGDSPTEKRFRRSPIRYNHVTRYLLVVWLMFGAINAFAGGYYGLSGAKGVPLEWLASSPFSDYFHPEPDSLCSGRGSVLIR